MANARRLRITIEVDDEGGPDDYNEIIEALSNIGAAILDEEELPAED